MEDSSAQSAQNDVLKHWLETAILHPTQSISIHSLQNDVVDKLKSGELPLKRAINQTLVAATRSQYRATETHLRVFVQEATQHVDDFAKVFANVLSTRAKAFAQSFGSARLIVLRLSCAVVATTLAASEGTPVWLAEVIKAQSVLLESTLNDSERAQALAQKALLRAIQAHSETLLPVYTAAITESASADTQQYALWLVLSQLTLDVETKEKLWKAYAFWAFDAKARTFVTLKKNDRRFQGLTIEQFDAILKPVIAKVLKKSPDSALEAVKELVRAVPLDLGKYLTELFNTVILAKLKSTKEDVRDFTIGLTKELLEGFQSVEHFSTLVAQISAMLDGKHGLLAQFYMREAAFAVLSDAADAIVSLGRNNDVKNLALSVIPSLVKAVDKEAHDQTRHLGLLALGKWLALAEELPKDALTKIQAGLKNKSEAVVAGYLRALAVFALQSKSGVAALEPLAAELTRIALESNKKPTIAHLDGVLAVGVAGALALSSTSLDQKFAQDGVSALALDANAFVLSSVKNLQLSLAQAGDNGRVEGRTKPEATALVVLTQALSWVLSSKQEDASATYQLLVELLTSSVLPARRAAEAALRSVYASSLDHVDGLLVAFQTKLATVAETLEKEQAQFLARKPSTIADDGSSASTTIVPPAGVLRRALRVIVSERLREEDAADVRHNVFARVMVLAHHPFVIEGRTPSTFGSEWQQLKLRFLPEEAKEVEEKDTEEEEAEEETADDRIDHLIEADETVKESLKALLADATDGLLYSARRLERLAAQRTLATLLNFAGNGEGESLALHDVVEDALMHRIDEEHIDAISEEDVGVFETPFDEIYVPRKGGEGSATTPAGKKRGGGRRGNEDEQWEQQVREELEKKKAKQAAAANAQKKYTPQEKALLAQQQERRLQLKETITIVARVLETVEMLTTVRPDEIHPALPRLLKSLRALFQTKLFADEAAFALRALAKAISPELLREHASDVASSLGVVLRLPLLESDKAKTEKLADVEELLTRTLASLMEVVFGFQFDTEDDFDGTAPFNRIAPPTFHLVLPVLRAILRFDPALRHWALPLLATHVRMIPEEEEEEVGDVAAQRLLRKDMLELVLGLLSQAAAGDIRPITNDDLAPAHLLTELCLGPLLSATEWAPLLGDRGLLAEAKEVRTACLKALVAVTESEDDEVTTDLGVASNPLLTSRLFVACFDAVESNRTLAKGIWESTGAELPKLFAGPLLVLLNHRHANVRESASLALADGMKQFPETITPLLNNLQSQFQSHVPKAMESIDEFGNPTLRRPGQPEPLEEPETYLPRCGVALCLEKAASSGVAFTKEHVSVVLSFVLDHGLVDPNAAVRAQMRKTGIQLVDAFGGKGNTSSLLQLFEQALEHKPSAKSKDAAEIERYDHQREGIVVCLGALAKHMDKTDPKVASIVDSLIDALNIPSESVQRSVATCLAPLIPAVKERSPQLLTDLLTRATSAETFGERIGAAFGVSAVVKGLGISALKQQDLIPRIEELMKNGGANGRQGAMLVFECLSERLGLLFEPYIIVILPIMLKCFADASPQVREAASQTSKKIMANLSAHGVKLVLPSLLRSMEDGAWRTKQAGIQLLGSMAYCAPRQLGSCLPQLVPKITDALTDSHPKVRESSKNALRDIGSVVRNPEIASISSSLLNALEDPNKYTTEALQQLQSTEFQHSIDAPSLALVMPIITRGLKDRAGDAKKKSALIVGSMCSMINDAKDLAPYMEMVLPSLKGQLMDPIPEVRAVAAKAMGKLVKGLGESHFSDILTWLLEAIKGDYGSVERSGAAQGLCEVLVALGKDRVESTLFNEIFPLSRHPKFSVREGVLWIIAFLPPALGKGFAVFLTDALPIIVSGLSDEADSVRDVAMHAGHVVVNAHALSHTRDILPSLEAGLFDDSWRIRQSSVTLLGDLMYRISGTRAVGLSEVSGGDVDEDDDAAGSAAGDKAIIKTLGMERRNAILSSLYMIRSDTSAVVRQSALQVWKSVVANTPKTLRQILPTLMSVIVSALSGNNVEKQTMAGRTLGEIVRKLGENVLPEVVPILRDGLAKENPAGMRQGACIGLSEVIECCNKKQLEDFVSTLVDAILDGLCDELPLVRGSAAQAFDVLQRNVGYRAIDETVPALLQRIKSSHVEAQERALNGLQEMLRVKSREVLPYLTPRLLTTPVSPAAVKAISRVAQATGPVVHYQIEKIFGCFVPQYVEFLTVNPSFAEEIKLALRDVVLAVEDAGTHWLAIEVCKYCEKETVAERALAFFLIAEFCANTTTHYSDQAPVLLRQIVTHLNDSDEDVVKAASDALKGMNATIRPEEFVKHVDFIRQTINSLVSEARHRRGGVGANSVFLLPGLCIPKGLEPFLPGYQFALMNGTPEQRQSAAAGLGELVQLSSAAALRPYLIKLTGPLIRIAGDRFPGHVKAAILETLEIILEKGGVALKPFLPQLQTTFVKALNDTASEVRRRGTSALGKLVALSPRIDPLVAELTEKLSTTSGGIREANLDALASIIQTVGDKVSSAVRTSLEDALVVLLEDSEDVLRENASKCIAYSVITDSEQGETHALTYGLANAKDVSSLSWTRKHSAAVFWDAVLIKNPWWIGGCADAVANVLASLGLDDHVTVRAAAFKAIAQLVKHGLGAVDHFVPILTQGIQHPNKDVSKSAVKIAKRLAKRDPESMRAHVATLVPPTFQLIKSNNIAVKMSAERSLLYLLEVQTRPETLAAYVRTDAANGKIIGEYARRVLAKLKADSGDESE
ncbi:hypothetical protein Poli38472_002206 [Pythium oligandrum]|uniref:TOG domain-containing protein n=1 Tax=Pythium oligandrum TaxID=41045 RepID=A0A8K1CHD6_PYTOL|nr:hypothetical protein Poli38472_002206 [Pythium oligandrum]|eukprot:TMW63265.1 hypothetical protein Poli38472_002206 [Pythium oligandrum]